MFGLVRVACFLALGLVLTGAMPSLAQVVLKAGHISPKGSAEGVADVAHIHASVVAVAARVGIWQIGSKAR